MQATKPDTKVCNECGVEKPFTKEFFWVSKQHPFGLRARCRACVRVDANQRGKERAAQLRLKVLQHYSNGLIPSCSCCGETGLEFLGLDHIDGGGRQERSRYKNQPCFIYSVIKREFPDHYRVLCHNCNQCLRVHGFCAHRPSEVTCSRPLEYKTGFLLQSRPLLEGEQEQACIKCDRVLPLTSAYFSRHRMMASGHLRMCKDCQRAIQLVQARKLKAKMKATVCTHYAGGSKAACVCCGIDEIAFLCIDHINGEGRKHRQENRISHFYRWLIKSGFPDGFQTLCYSCNQAKKDKGHCPHQSR